MKSKLVEFSIVFTSIKAKITDAFIIGKELAAFEKRIDRLFKAMLGRIVVLH